MLQSFKGVSAMHLEFSYSTPSSIIRTFLLIHFLRIKWVEHFAFVLLHNNQALTIQIWLS